MFARTTFGGLIRRCDTGRRDGPSHGKAFCMRKSSVPVAAMGIAAALALAACGSSGGGGGGTSAASTPAASTPASSAPASSAPATSGGGATGAINGKGAKVGIILPDRQSSNRWISSDPIALAARCKADNLNCTIQNANNSASQFITIAQSMMNNGAKVLILTALDSASAGKVESQAKAKGIISIDYDRLVTGGTNTLYVSFDNTVVGKEQGETLVKCPQVAGKSSVKYVDVNGSPTDNNATLFKNGYDSVLSKQPGWTKVADQSIPDWDNQQAGVTFASMLQKNPGIQAVMVANDGMAGSVIADLAKQKLNGKVAVSGQDATVQGLQRILTGNQCFTIYKPSVLEANPAVDAAAQLANGQIPKTTQFVVDPVSHNKVPSMLATPIAITKANVAQPINDGYTPKAQTCTGQYAELCTKAGVK
jgi:D-xylose transport system substrate-binding protein